MNDPSQETYDDELIFDKVKSQDLDIGDDETEYDVLKRIWLDIIEETEQRSKSDQ